MNFLRVFAHIQPLYSCDFHAPGRLYPVKGSLGSEPSVGTAIAQLTLGAGAFPREVSMGLLGLAGRLDRWTGFQ